MAPSPYLAALDRFHELHAEELADPRLNPECYSRLLHHDAPTARAVVLCHGITSSPPQFAQLGELFFARGYNVLIPRMPAHGFRDRLTRAPALLTTRDYTAHADRVIAIGRGLGAHLTMVGLSVSGILVAWAAQVRDGIDRAVLLAPSFAPVGVPLPLVPALSRLALWLPNLFVWWDPRMRARLQPATSYPWFSTHALAESFRLAACVVARAGREPPKTRDIACLVNARDPAVSNRATAAVLRAWQRRGARVRAHAFTRELGHLHDFVGPYQRGARPDLVYPSIWELVDQHA